MFQKVPTLPSKIKGRQNQVSYTNGENYDSFMLRVVPCLEQVDVENILSRDSILRGLRDRLNEAGTPSSDLVLRIFVLESCGIIAYDQLDLFFEPTTDRLCYRLSDRFVRKLDELGAGK